MATKKVLTAKSPKRAATKLPSPLGPLLCCLIILLSASACKDSSTPSPTPKPAKRPQLPSQSIFNGKTPKVIATEFSFLVGGHLYGAANNKAAARPARSLVSAIPFLNRQDLDFFISLGDLIEKPKSQETAASLAIFANLAAPMLNARGNHELDWSTSAYTARFGPRYFQFDIHHTRFFVCDTSAEAHSIDPEQLAWLKAELRKARDDKNIRSVFCFGHHVVFGWAREAIVALLGSNAAAFVREAIDKYGDKIPRPPFETELRPLLKEIATQKQLVWFAGDMGAYAEQGVHFFHQTLSGGNLQFVALGLGDLDRDALCRVRVASDGSVQLKGLNLKSHKEFAPETFSASYWWPKIDPDGKLRRLCERLPLSTD